LDQTSNVCVTLWKATSTFGLEDPGVLVGVNHTISRP